MAASMAKACARLLHQHTLKFGVQRLITRRSSSSSNILKLAERGVFQNVFPEERSADLHKSLIGSPQCMYCGFDPTADSLHVGNLLAIIALLHGQRAGHQVIAVLGGATACIGDPSGRMTERSSMSRDDIHHNLTTIQQSIERIFINHYDNFWTSSKQLKVAKILNNADWYTDVNIIQFLSTVGKYFRMGDLLGRKSVQSRLNSPEGMSLTEFSYQVFQSYDWLHLYKNYDCKIQIGGNDQLGNITSGHDLISKVTRKTVFGLTVPLVKSTTGDKLGKTAGNAVWLNPDKTSAFELYQYFLNFADSEVEHFLKLFTFLPDAEISEIMKKHKREPAHRRAQRKLAENVTTLVHGAKGLSSAKRCTEVLFNKSSTTLATMEESELRDLFKSAQTSEVYLEPGTSVLDAVMAAKCFNREVDADRVIRAGGVYINHHRISEPSTVLILGQHILLNHITLIRVGKKNYYIVKWLV